MTSGEGAEKMRRSGGSSSRQHKAKAAQTGKGQEVKEHKGMGGGGGDMRDGDGQRAGTQKRRVEGNTQTDERSGTKRKDNEQEAKSERRKLCTCVSDGVDE